MRFGLSSQDQHQLQGLIEALGEGSVIGMCGAGLSAPLGYPTWTELMFWLLDRYELTSYEPPSEGIRLTIEAGRADLPQLAQWIRSKMDRMAYQDFLREVFLPRGRVDYSLEHECLVKLPVRAWMTTNYDSCLTESLAAQLGRNVTPSAEIPFQALIGGREILPKIVHLHGWADVPESIVLTAEDYDRLYYQETRRSHELSSLAAFTLLFVGYSLEDREFNQCLETTKARLGRFSRQHYAILGRNPEETGFELELKAGVLRRKGVQPIFYPCSNGNHSLRLEILRSLMESLGLPLPNVGYTLDLRWKERSASLQEVREALKRLSSGVSATSFILRSCSWSNSHLTLSSNSEEEIRHLRSVAAKDPYWTTGTADITVVNPVLSTSRTTERQPPRSQRKTSKEKEDMRLGGTGPSPGERISPEESTDRDSAAERHLKMLQRDALGQLEPAHPHYHHILPSLMPPPLPLGLSDLFHPVLSWRLDSPVIHVWIYTEGLASPDQPSEVRAVTAVGLGPLHVREELESAAYSIALSMPFDASSIITRGLIHLALPETYDPPAPASSILSRVATQVFGRGTPPVPLAMPTDVKESFLNFRAVCERIAQMSGFLRVHEISYSALRDFQTLLLRHAIGADKAKIVTIMRPAPAGVVKCLPYPRFPRPHLYPRLSLRCSGDLLRTPALQGLLDAYYQNVVIRLRADLERRIEFWTQELEGDEAGVSWFKSLSPEERAKVPDVVTGREILDDFAVSVQTTESRVPAEDFYLRRIANYHIPREKKILQELGAAREPLARLASTNYSPVWRRCLARIFDCALRHVPLCDDSRLNALFESWCSRVNGFLRVEWTRICQEHGVAAEDVFKRTTYFNVEFKEDDDAFEIFPNAVIDSGRSTVIMDPARRTLVIEDPLDFATSFELEKESELSDIPPHLLEGEELDPSAIACQLKEEIFRRPTLATAICDQTLRGSSPEDGLGEVRKTVRHSAEEATAGYRGLYQLANSCFNTAEEILRPRDALDQDVPAGKSLARAVMLCLNAGLPPHQTLRTLRDRPDSFAPSEVKREFRRARLRDRAVVDQFLDGAGIGSDQFMLSPQEEVLWKVEQCLECARLAEDLRRAAEELDPQRETLGSVFFKAERAFENAHAAVFTRPPTSLLRIQKILSGEPLGEQKGEAD